MCPTLKFGVHAFATLVGTMARAGWSGLRAVRVGRRFLGCRKLCLLGMAFVKVCLSLHLNGTVRVKDGVVPLAVGAF